MLYAVGTAGVLRGCGEIYQTTIETMIRSICENLLNTAVDKALKKYHNWLVKTNLFLQTKNQAAMLIWIFDLRNILQRIWRRDYVSGNQRD